MQRSGAAGSKQTACLEGRAPVPCTTAWAAASQPGSQLTQVLGCRYLPPQFVQLLIHRRLLSLIHRCLTLSPHHLHTTQGDGFSVRLSLHASGQVAVLHPPSMLTC
jgi:hypothetical protein